MVFENLYFSSDRKSPGEESVDFGEM